MSDIPGQLKLNDTDVIIKEINELIHFRLDKEWMAKEWKKLELSGEDKSVHPLVRVAFKAHQQIQNFISTGSFGITPEILELAELAIKINELNRNKILFLQERIDRLTSSDYNLYLKSRYEIQIAGALLQRGHGVEFINEGNEKTPDILVTSQSGRCEIECKYKDSSDVQIDYVRSIYNNIQKARKQFSKTCPGLISIDIDRIYFEEFSDKIKILKDVMERAMYNSSSISAILITAKIVTDDEADYIYRHSVFGFLNPKARHLLPAWLSNNFISNP
jgi:hypothetical protein